MLAKLQPDTEYEIFVKEDEIVFKKTHKGLTLKELRLLVIQFAGSDPNQPTLEEISQIVKEVQKRTLD